MTVFCKASLALIIFLLLGACVSVNEKKVPPKEIATVNANLAAEYFRQNRLEYALANLKKALAADPESVDANSLMALVYDRLEQPEKAEEHFKIALDFVAEDSVKFGEIHNNFAIFLCSHKRPDEAEAHFTIATSSKLYKSPEGAFENAGICALQNRDSVKAKQNFLKALEVNPKLPRSLWEMAKIQWNQQDYLSAREYLHRLHTINKAVPETLLLAIKVEQKIGDSKKQQELIDQLVSNYPEAEQTKQFIDKP